MEINLERFILKLNIFICFNFSSSNVSPFILFIIKLISTYKSLSILFIRFNNLENPISVIEFL